MTGSEEADDRVNEVFLALYLAHVERVAGGHKGATIGLWQELVSERLWWRTGVLQKWMVRTALFRWSARRVRVVRHGVGRLEYRLPPLTENEQVSAALAADKAERQEREALLESENAIARRGRDEGVPLSAVLRAKGVEPDDDDDEDDEGYSEDDPPAW
jgi:hypothetical protein